MPARQILVTIVYMKRVRLDCNGYANIRWLRVKAMVSKSGKQELGICLEVMKFEEYFNIILPQKDRMVEYWIKTCSNVGFMV